MKKLEIGYCEMKSEQKLSKGVQLWQDAMYPMVEKNLENNEPLDMAQIMSRAFTQDVADAFTKVELIRLLDTTPTELKQYRELFIKIISELSYRYAQHPNAKVELKDGRVDPAIRQYLSFQGTSVLEEVLEHLLENSRYETACFVRDEINFRKNK
jgi:LPS O-antigen subunit length determinant protein (WzzB/FepE family)